MRDSDPASVDLNTDVAQSARMYDYCLGGKDNFAVDRAAVMALISQFREGLDVTRENRLFLYRVVRFLTRDAGIRQFLDMGSGLPTQANVHQVAQQFQADARVVYVDHDPIVLAHGRWLLAEETTTVIQADMTETDEILAHPDVRRLIDFAQPTAVLFLSVAHSIPDDERLRTMFSAVVDVLPAGSYLALSQFVGVDAQSADSHPQKCTDLGLVWKTRTIDDFRTIAAGTGLEPVPPGLADVAEWRPDPGQPPLSPVDEALKPFAGAAVKNKQVKEFGGSSTRLSLAPPQASAGVTDGSGHRSRVTDRLAVTAAVLRGE
jgi:hypothetical protein